MPSDEQKTASNCANDYAIRVTALCHSLLYAFLSMLSISPLTAVPVSTELTIGHIL